jgi:4-hydroxy-3-methylbut-2-enyl diphosphate reductase
MKIILAQPRGFCAGVDRAVVIVEKSLEKYGAPIYVRHEIVHNKYVVDGLRSKGVIFVDEISEIPNGSIAIFSAHGVSKKVEEDADNLELTTIDATCPLVKKVHKEAIKSENEGRKIILIGHKGHAEVEGTSGRVNQDVLLVQTPEDIASLEIDDPNKLAYVTQTTLSVDDTKEIIARLKERFPNIKGPDLKDICYATTNRQNAVRELSEQVDVVLVIGSKNSSNSNRLRDLAVSMEIPAYLINDYNDIDLSWFENIKSVGITAGASAPDILVDEVITFLGNNFDTSLSVMDGLKENVNFKLPDILAS